MKPNPPTYSELQQAEHLLRDAGILSPEKEIVTILSEFFNIPRYRAVNADFTLEPAEWARFRELVKERSNHQPLQYILGSWGFWKYEFHVNRDVLIPRPETEHLVEIALSLLPSRTATRIIDCCTGSGCVAISIALERPHSRVIGCDISPAALATAFRNKIRHCADNCDFIAMDLLNAFPPNSVNLITANPPYIPSEQSSLLQKELSFEPPEALFSGKDGLNHIRSLLRHAPAILKKNGCLIFEFGYNQGEEIRKLVHENQVREIRQFEIRRDFGNHERIGFIRYA